MFDKYAGTDGDFDRSASVTERVTGTALVSPELVSRRCKLYKSAVEIGGASLEFADENVSGSSVQAGPENFDGEETDGTGFDSDVLSIVDSFACPSARSLDAAVDTVNCFVRSMFGIAGAALESEVKLGARSVDSDGSLSSILNGGTGLASERSKSSDLTGGTGFLSEGFEIADFVGGSDSEPEGLVSACLSDVF